MGPCPAQVLRSGQGLDRGRGRDPNRPPVRNRACEQWPSAEARLTRRGEQSAPILAELESWRRAQRDRTSRKSEIGKAIDYALKRWTALSRFLTHGRICISKNAAERALRGIAVGRHNWTFAGSDRGGERAAAMYTLIETAKLNGVDPQAWLADVLARLPDHPARQLDDLLPWSWTPAWPSVAA